MLKQDLSKCETSVSQRSDTVGLVRSGEQERRDIHRSNEIVNSTASLKYFLYCQFSYR